MIETQFKALMHGGIFVDPNLLHKGIYEAPKPCIYGKYMTMEKLIDEHKKVKDFVGGLYFEDHFENLQKCELINITINIEYGSDYKPNDN